MQGISPLQLPTVIRNIAVLAHDPFGNIFPVCSGSGCASTSFPPPGMTLPEYWGEEHAGGMVGRVLRGR